MNSPGSSTELDGIDNDQQLFAIKFINHGQATDAEQTETYIPILQRGCEEMMQAVSERIIGNKIIADTDNKAPGH
jgi:hypothetical protein